MLSSMRLTHTLVLMITWNSIGVIGVVTSRCAYQCVFQVFTQSYKHLTFLLDPLLPALVVYSSSTCSVCTLYVYICRSLVIQLNVDWVTVTWFHTELTWGSLCSSHLNSCNILLWSSRAWSAGPPCVSIAANFMFTIFQVAISYCPNSSWISISKPPLESSFHVF